jgi:hypothetical protein
VIVNLSDICIYKVYQLVTYFVFQVCVPRLRDHMRPQACAYIRAPYMHLMWPASSPSCATADETRAHWLEGDMMPRHSRGLPRPTLYSRQGQYFVHYCCVSTHNESSILASTGSGILYSSCKRLICISATELHLQLLHRIRFRPLRYRTLSASQAADTHRIWWL